MKSWLFCTGVALSVVGLPSAAPAEPACQNCDDLNRSGVESHNEVSEDEVRLSNGNFLLSHQDLTVPGRGLPLEIVRTYNAQPNFDLPEWEHEPERGGSTWFVDGGMLRGEGDRILTKLTYPRPLRIQVQMKTVAAQPGEADVAGDQSPFLPAQPQSWHTAWINFFYEDYRNFYSLVLHHTGTLELTRLQNGLLTTLATAPTGKNPHDWHLFDIQALGGQITVWIDDAKYIDYLVSSPDSVPTRGKVALNAYWCQALFDDLRINGLLVDNFNRPSPMEQSIFGWGWIWNYGMKLTEFPGQGVLITRGDGGTYFFPLSPDGQSFTPPPGVFGELIRNPDGSLRYLEKDGILYRFDTEGKLIQVTDRNQNSVMVSYDSQERPTRITGPTGLSLDFSYGSNGKVSRISDPMGQPIQYSYDAAGNLTLVSDPLGRSVRYAYYPNHAMKSWTDKTGNPISTNTYWYNRRIASQKDPLDKTTRFHYRWDQTAVKNARDEVWVYIWKEGAPDRPARIVDPLGRTEWFAWDAQARLVGTTNRNGHQTEFFYDAKGNIVRTIRRQGEGQILQDTRFWYDSSYSQVTQIVDTTEGRTTFEYDPVTGNLLRSARWLWSQPLVTEFTYDTHGQLLSKRDPRGAVTRYEYDLHGRRTAEIDPLGGRTTFSWDLLGRLLSTTDPLGRTTEFTYDLVGNLLSARNPLGHVTSSTYDADGRVLTVTDPNGQVTRNEYDALGNLVRVTDPIGAVTRYEYDTTSYLLFLRSARVSVTDPLGQTTRTTVDAYDRPTAVTDPLGNVTRTEYDGVGNVTAVVDPEGRRTTNVYDPLDRLVSTTDPAGNVTRFTYNGNGDLLSVTDPRGNVTRWEYDTLHRKITVVEPTGARTAFAYDAVDNLVSVTDAAGNVSTITYDLLSRKRAVNDPDFGAWSYEYDAADNLTQQTDAKGQILEFTYDALNRPLQKSGRANAGLPPELLATYLYDDPARPFSIGRLSRVTDPSGSEDFWHDELGRVVRTVKRIGAEEFTVSQAYDLNGRPTAVTYPDGEVVQTAYDAAGRPTQVSGAVAYIQQAAYNRAGQPTRVTFGNQAITTYSYDGAGRLSRLITDQNRQDLSYQFDPAGNVASIADLVGTATQSFTYDSLNRLTQAVGASYGTRVYRYNDIGNLIEKAGVAYSYGQGGSKPHAVTAGSDGFVGVYDANGNMTRRGQHLLSYDLEGRLLEIGLAAPVAPSDRFRGVAASGGGSAGSQMHIWMVLGEPSMAGSVSSPGLRARLGFYPGVPSGESSGAMLRYEYDHEGERVRTLVEGSRATTHVGDLYEVTDGVPTKQIWMGPIRVALVSGLTTAPSPDGPPAPPPSRVLYYHPDHLGSASVVTDATGAVVERIEYRPYGQTQSDTGTQDVPWKFTGKRLDGESGMYYFGARYYDPALGRWITPDPTVPDPDDPQAFNRYSYVRNNPVRFVDPDGYFWTPSPVGVAIGAVFGLDAPPVGDMFSRVIGAMVAGSDIGRSVYGSSSRGSRSWTAAMVEAALEGRDPAEAVEAAGLGGGGSSSGDSYTGTGSKSIKNSWAVRVWRKGQKLLDRYGWAADIMFLGAALLEPTPAGELAFAGRVATRAGGSKGARKLLEKAFFRNMSRAEAEFARSTGKLRFGKAGETFFTDSKFRSATKAKDRLSLPKSPEVQMEFRLKSRPQWVRRGTKVKPNYGGRGGGREYSTYDQVEVEVINVQPYR